jgi:uncharacterized protein YqgC (DUF456 family)
MDIFLIVTGGLLTLTGILGCIIPGLPGPPLNFIALLLLQATSHEPFTIRFLILWGLVVLIVTVLDYVFPVWGAKKFGATGWGIFGSFAGLLIGIIFFPPLGLIAGPFLGAIAGEFVAGKSWASAIKAGIGSFIGFVFGTVLKLAISGIMTYYFIRGIVQML